LGSEVLFVGRAAGVADQGRGHAAECTDSPRHREKSSDTLTETVSMLVAAAGPT
jgi:hypothetical protein